MTDDAVEDNKVADIFMRQCVTHIGNASDVQKNRLMRALVERPPINKDPITVAQAVWNGLTEKEIMQLLGILQKQFDKDTWEFMTRWRI